MSLWRGSSNLLQQRNRVNKPASSTVRLPTMRVRLVALEFGSAFGGAVEPSGVSTNLQTRFFRGPR